jgi:hypothetical protein
LNRKLKLLVKIVDFSITLILFLLLIYTYEFLSQQLLLILYHKKKILLLILCTMRNITSIFGLVLFQTKINLTITSYFNRFILAKYLLCKDEYLFPVNFLITLGLFFFDGITLGLFLLLKYTYGFL